MADDDDLKGIIPDPPRPDGDRRSEAMEAALRRFDAHAGESDPETHSPPRKAPVRRQLAVLASAMLVLLVTVPILISQGDNLGRVDAPAESVAEPTAPVREAGAGQSRGRNSAVPIADAEKVSPSPEPAPEINATQSAARVPSPSAQGEEQPPALAAAAPETAQDSYATSPPARRSAESDALSPPRRLGLAPPPPPSPPPPPPPPPVSAARAQRLAEADDAAANIVVTGSRVQAPDRATSRRLRMRPSSRQIRRWQACTVADPRKDAARCAGSDAPGSADLARGLELAFQGRDEAALRAFDVAITRTPQGIGGYLNRSLLYRRRGDAEAARGDLDGAIRVAPGDPRGYYFRSLLLRDTGDVEGADRDLATALRFDNS